MKKLTTDGTEGTEKKRFIVQLVSGLLASGHYTEIVTHEEYAAGHPITEPRLKFYEVDWEDWKESGYPRKNPFHVIDDAESLLRDIEFITEQEEENKLKEKTYLSARYNEWERIAKALGDPEPECSGYGYLADLIEANADKIKKIIHGGAK